MEKLINNAPFALVLVFLVIGFVLLIKGADFFVEGSSSVAKRLHVPSIIIGLTIVAMGTSLPETAVSVSASLAGNNELAVSNVVGSNIFNLMVVIGVCAMIATVEVARETIRRDIPLSLICAGLLLLLGIIGIGDQTNMTLIGLTIVSIGTSLPELVTSIVAARKNEVDMALGNAIGSNVFNILMVLGIASAISPISIITENIIDLCVLIAFTVCVWIFAGSKKKIGRVEGFCMVALYAAYAVYIIIR